jgi:O-antigen/teichoic acid export membrane protein
MSAERTVAHNTIWLTLQPLAMNVAALAATMYLTRQLGAAEWGRFNLCLAFVAMFAPLANLGLRTLASRHAAAHRETASEYLGQVLVLRVLLSVATAILLIVAAPLACGGASVPGTIAVLALGLVATTAMQAMVDSFQAFEVVRPASIAQFVGGAGLTICSVLVVWAGGGLRELAMAYALGPVCTLVLLWIWSRNKPFRPRLSWQPAVAGPLLRQALPFFGIILLGEVGARVDVVVMARVLSETSLGCYTAAIALVDRSMMLVDGAATALLPAVALLSRHSRSAAAPLLQKAALWCLVITLPVAVLTTVFAPQAVRLIYGPQYATASAVLAYGIWRLPLMALAVVAGNALFAAGRQDLELRTNAISIIAGLLLLYPLVLWLGPIGGALASSLRHLIAWLIRLPAVWRDYPNLWAWRPLARCASALAVMSLPLLLLPALGPGLLGLLLAPVAVLFYLAGLSLVQLLPLRATLAGLRRRRDSSYREAFETL